MVFQKEPTPESSGNGLRLVDWWGPDGRTLAAVSLWWQEDSDVGGHGILIYRAETKRVVEPDLDALFSRSLRRECSLRLDDIPGFTESGELVVKVTSTGGPGSIIASALSLSADRTQVFRVPMRDRTVKSAPGSIRGALMSPPRRSSTSKTRPAAKSNTRYTSTLMEAPTHSELFRSREGRRIPMTSARCATVKCRMSMATRSR